jgi:hypothetical protein
VKARYVLPLAATALLGSFALHHSAAQACIDVITCACNNTTGVCQEFPTPCSVPRGWTVCDGCCAGGLGGADPSGCLDVISYARNPDTGECVEFPTSCTPPGWARCSGGA